jgi:hypothetical protein
MYCGTVGTVTGGGAIGATLERSPSRSGRSPDFAPRQFDHGLIGLLLALLTVPFQPTLLNGPPAELPPCAKDAVRNAKAMKKTKATFTEMFDMGSSTSVR